MIKYLFTVMLFSLTACNRPSVKSAALNSIDTSKYDIYRYSRIKGWQIFKDTVSDAPLTANEITQIEKLIKKATFDTNIRQPANYFKQMTAVVDKNGDKIVWVNCFCSKNYEFWHRAPLFAEDGGSCYFRLKVNLTKGTFYDLTVNGLG